MTTHPLAIPDFAGELIAPGEPGFDEARRVEDETVDRRPALIARCAGPRDVAAAIAHARRAGLPLTVRGGGHGPDGFAVADDALVIDLTRMRDVCVNSARRRVRVDGGATWRELDAATQASGLAVTGARLPSVGVAGFTLGSGSGWLERRLGLAADSMRGARVVTADGDLVTASADENADLFWALRGGGASFGVVAELEFALHPVGPIVTGGILAWPAARTGEVAAAYAELMADAPDDLGGGLSVLNAPPLPFVPEALHGAPVAAVTVLWTGRPARGEELIAPLRALAPSLDAVGPIPYAGLQGMFESPERFTARIHVEAGFLTGLAPEAVDAFATQQALKPAPMGALLMQPLGGAFARVAEGTTPLGQRDAPWSWQAGAAWFEPELDGPVREWAASLREAIAPWSRGETYPNFILDRDPARLRAAYAPAAWERLRAIRADWDPDDAFGAGHAIPLPGSP